MTIRFLADENVPRPSILLLREQGWDVEAIADSMPGASDVRVIEEAIATGRWILTFDRDYGELVFRHRFASPAAIIYFRQAAYSATWPAEVLIDLLRDAGSIAGHLVVVGDGVVRRRRLPATAAPR